MEKKCCNASITELENGYRVEITGDDVKGNCKSMFEKCCMDEKMKGMFESCCGTKSEKGCC